MENNIFLTIAKLSSSPTIKSEVLKSLISSDNVYIHSRQIEVAIQEYESTTDFKTLNNATTIEDYFKIKELYSFQVYNEFLEDFKLFCGEKTEDKELIIIPLSIIFFDNYKNRIKFTGKHSAITLINLKSKTIYIVDSDNEETVKNNIAYNESNYDYYLKRKVKACVECIYTDKFKIKVVDTKAPQFLTKDLYCIFWSFLITQLIVEQYDKSNKISPTLVLKNIMKEYKTKKNLNQLIQDYIKKFFTTI
jgi:hypothetical protein